MLITNSLIGEALSSISHFEFAPEFSVFKFLLQLISNCTVNKNLGLNDILLNTVLPFHDSITWICGHWYA
jgi:hypothetical protein